MALNIYVVYAMKLNAHIYKPAHEILVLIVLSSKEGSNTIHTGQERLDHTHARIQEFSSGGGVGGGGWGPGQSAKKKL